MDIKKKSQSKNTPVAKPTWLKDIRYLFTPTDVSHMANHKNPTIHLDDYDDVKQKFNMINSQVQFDGMPPDNPWPAAWKKTFLNWKANDFAKGTEIPRSLFMVEKMMATPSRMRKEISTLTKDEINKLTMAFEELIKRDPSDKNSYYHVAGYHGEPDYYCSHMVPPFSSWHRAYMLNFENTLRTVKGCEDITLPYWDFNKPFPELLQKAPFDKYTFPKDTGDYKKGATTERNSVAAINKSFANMVIPDMNRAMKKGNWQEFHGYFNDTPNNTLQMAHNNGHNLTGPTLQNPVYASFDPMFWFFHANWDRLWWKWQKDVVNARDWATLKTVMTKTSKKGNMTPSYSFFLQNSPLAPFNQKPQDLLDIVEQLGYDYDAPPATKQDSMDLHPAIHASIPAAEKFMVNTQHVNVRVKGVNRLAIPGSFWVHLLKDGKRIDSKSHFQFDDPNKCKTCADNPIVFFDFELPLTAIQDGKLSVEIEPNNKDFIGDRVPMSMAGNPTINARLLLRQE